MVNYYVRTDFEESYPAGSLDLRRLERQVEDEFVANLQHNCYRERSYRKCLAAACCPVVVSVMSQGSTKKENAEKTLRQKLL